MAAQFDTSAQKEARAVTNSIQTENESVLLSERTAKADTINRATFTLWGFAGKQKRILQH
jgi:hypothetical protein